MTQTTFLAPSAANFLPAASPEICSSWPKYALAPAACQSSMPALNATTGDQKFVYSRPVRAGDRLSVTVTIDSIKSLAGNDVLSVRGEVEDATGEHVVTSVMTLVARAADEAGE